jgi:hypothetical protein
MRKLQRFKYSKKTNKRVPLCEQWPLCELTIMRQVQLKFTIYRFMIEEQDGAIKSVTISAHS